MRTFERLFAHLAARVTPARTAEAAVAALVDGHLEWILSHPDEYKRWDSSWRLEGRI